MRLSVLKNDSGYKVDAWKYQPYLNGRKVVECVTAEDGVNGFVTCYHSSYHNQQMYTAYGKVELEYCN